MRRLFLSALVLCLATTSAFANAHLIIRNTNAAGVGFNDATPATPVAGNAGTTLGQQRLNVFQRAADIWGALIDSKVDILVDASFASLDCGTTSAVLGQASATRIVRNFTNAPQQNVWYPIALADALAGQDLLNTGVGTPQPHIQAQFNSQIDSPSCLGGVGWYYGFDANHGTKEDLLVVLLHELGHGLGFAGVTNGATGAMSSNFPSVFEQHMFDNTVALHWSQMTDSQRLTSSTNDQNVVWDGSSTTTAALKFLGGTPTFRISAPVSVAKTYQINTAAFGPHLTVAGINGTIAATLPADGCNPITNAGAITGHIALIDRGTCNFTVKVKNAQIAGATAVIVADNVPADIPPLGGDDSTITIPTIGVSQADGVAIRAALTTTVSAFMFADPTILAGADVSGHPKLYVPLTFANGSSMYHFDVSATPDLLMEPNINSDLPSDSVDLTINELFDIGWKAATTPQTGRFAGRRGH
ncbi:MAG TPA: PA domain-containing protein [Thermoanaerobaculia bacterium]|nr:PA domain-containing protein [Thermoanaerobaculia bacterium]